MSQATAQSLYARDMRALSQVAKIRFFPLAAVAGSGSYLINEDGRRLLDLCGGWSAAHLGYGHPAVVAAVTDAVTHMPSVSLISGANATATALAERLLKAPLRAPDRRVWIGHSGSDANEALSTLIALSSGRPDNIALAGGYHGSTLGARRLSSHHALAGMPGSKPIVLGWPDAENQHQLLAQLDEILDRRGHSIGAIWIEPIQSDAGVRIAPPGFLRAVAERCQAHGVLVVSDEVKVGLGRSGKLHAFEHEAFEPDCIVFGKGLGGGLPISAAVGPAEVMDVEGGFALTTLVGNPVCSAAACAVLDTIESEHLVANARDRGAELRAGLQALADRRQLIRAVRGRGLMVGVEFGHGRSPATQQCAAFVYRCFELGVVCFYVGEGSNVVELTPPLTISAAEVDLGLGIFEQALDDVESGRVDLKAVGAFTGW